MRILRGRGRLTGLRAVLVDDEEVVARTGIVIATGTRPAVPDIPGLADIQYLTNREVFRQEWLPDSLLCIGGGVIGVELAQALARLHVRVTLAEPGYRVAGNEEPETSALLADALRADGIRLMEGVGVVKLTGTRTSVLAKLSTGRALAIAAVLVATGRRTCLDDLGLETVGLSAEAESLDVDDRMQLDDGLWAIGDVTGKGLYTHVAHYQAELAAAAILGDSTAPKADYRAVPRVTFTDPEIASVGLTAQQARDAGLAVRTACADLDTSSRAWLHGPGACGLVKLVADDAAGQLVGATLVGPTASETIGLLTLAVHARVPIEQLSSMIYGFPSFNDAIKHALADLGED